jgi:hypothetical protein
LNVQKLYGKRNGEEREVKEGVYERVQVFSQRGGGRLFIFA